MSDGDNLSLQSIRNQGTFVKQKHTATSGAYTKGLERQLQRFQDDNLRMRREKEQLARQLQSLKSLSETNLDASLDARRGEAPASVNTQLVDESSNGSIDSAFRISHDPTEQQISHDPTEQQISHDRAEQISHDRVEQISHDRAEQISQDRAEPVEKEQPVIHSSGIAKLEALIDHEKKQFQREKLSFEEKNSVAYDSKNNTKLKEMARKLEEAATEILILRENDKELDVRTKKLDKKLGEKQQELDDERSMRIRIEQIMDSLTIKCSELEKKLEESENCKISSIEFENMKLELEKERGIVGDLEIKLANAEEDTEKNINEILSLEQDLRNESETCRQLKDEVQLEKVSLEASNAERKCIKETLDEARQELQAKEKFNAENNKILQKLKEESRKMEAELHTNNLKNINLTAELDENKSKLKYAISALKMAEGEVLELQDFKNSFHESQKQYIEEEKEVREELQEKFRESNLEIKHQNEEMESLEITHKKELGRKEALQEELENEVKKYEIEILDLKRIMGKISTEKFQLQQKIDGMLARMSEEQTENMGESTISNGSINSSRPNDVNNGEKLCKKEQNLRDLEAKITELIRAKDKATEDQSNLQQKLRNLESENKAMQTKLNETIAGKQNINRNLDSLQKENERLKKQLQEQMLTETNTSVAKAPGEPPVKRKAGHPSTTTKRAAEHHLIAVDVHGDRTAQQDLERRLAKSESETIFLRMELEKERGARVESAELLERAQQRGQSVERLQSKIAELESKSLKREHQLNLICRQMKNRIESYQDERVTVVAAVEPPEKLSEYFLAMNALIERSHVDTELLKNQLIEIKNSLETTSTDNGRLKGRLERAEQRVVELEGYMDEIFDDSENSPTLLSDRRNATGQSDGLVRHRGVGALHGRHDSYGVGGRTSQRSVKGKTPVLPDIVGTAQKLPDLRVRKQWII